jgi:hypothetical protein
LIWRWRGYETICSLQGGPLTKLTDQYEPPAITNKMLNDNAAAIQPPSTLRLHPCSRTQFHRATNSPRRMRRPAETTRTPTAITSNQMPGRDARCSTPLHTLVRVVLHGAGNSGAIAGQRNRQLHVEFFQGVHAVLAFHRLDTGEGDVLGCGNLHSMLRNSNGGRA